MKIILFGAQGQLGWELHRALAPLGDLQAVDRDFLDLSDRAALKRFLLSEAPDLIVNASAYTAVDQAEREPDLADQLNRQAPALMAETACALKAGFIHYSTDYVFNGELGRPYVESDETGPLNVYGESKLLGEQAVRALGGASLILRTAWVYSLRAESFVTKVMAWARQKPELRIVSDQVSNPTWARMLAQVTALLVGRAGTDVHGYLERHAGLYHLAGRGYASRLEWAERILAADPKRDEHRVRLVQPASTDEFPAPARRPFFSALNCTLFEATFGLQLPAWEYSLGLAMESARGDRDRTETGHEPDRNAM